MMTRIIAFVSLLLSLLMGSFGEGSVTDCCAQKKVGDFVYNFEEIGDGKEHGCFDNCIYSRQGDPDQRFCFKKGDLTATCQEKSDECDIAVTMNWNLMNWKDGQCIVDTESRFFDSWVLLEDSNTPDLCIEKCSKMEKNGPLPTTDGFVFAGLEAGSYCFCGSCVPPRSIFANASECDVKCPGDDKFNCGGQWRMNVYTTGLKQGYKELNDIIDGFTGLAVTPDTREVGSKIYTKPKVGSTTDRDSELDQKWKMDSEGRIVNRLTGLVIEATRPNPTMQEKIPLTKSKQWKLRSDIRSVQETQPKTVPKLVEDDQQFCLNTADRFDPAGSQIIMWDATQAHPNNSHWIPNFLEWRPILDCNNPDNAITTDGPNVGSKLATKPFTGDDNQMWSFDSERRLVNKETGLVIQADGPTMQEPSPLAEIKQWRYRIDIRSSQETAEATVAKIVNGGGNALNTADRFTSTGSPIGMYPADSVNPGNACWLF